MVISVLLLVLVDKKPDGHGVAYFASLSLLCQ